MAQCMQTFWHESYWHLPAHITGAVTLDTDLIVNIIVAFNYYVNMRGVSKTQSIRRINNTHTYRPRVYEITSFVQLFP